MSVKLGIYQHYKGNLYQVLSVARHSEDLSKYVVYQALYGDYSIWIRPYLMFIEKVNVDGKEQPRFAFKHSNKDSFLQLD